MAAAPLPLDSSSLSPQRNTPAHAQPGFPSPIPAYLDLVMEKGRDLVVNAGNSFSCKV